MPRKDPVISSKALCSLHQNKKNPQTQYMFYKRSILRKLIFQHTKYNIVYEGSTCKNNETLDILTVPETFYFPLFPFVHHALSLPSGLVLRSAFSARSHSPFIKRSAFAHRTFICRSKSVNRSLRVLSQYTFSEHWSCKIDISLFERKKN